MPELTDIWDLEQILEPGRERSHTSASCCSRHVRTIGSSASILFLPLRSVPESKNRRTHTVAQAQLDRGDKKTTPTRLLRLEEIMSHLWLELVHHDVERAVGRCDGRSLVVVRDVGVPVVAIQRAMHVGRPGEHGVEEVHFVGERLVRVDLRAHGDRSFFFTCCVNPLPLSSSRYVNSKKGDWLGATYLTLMQRILPSRTSSRHSKQALRRL